MWRQEGDETMLDIQAVEEAYQEAIYAYEDMVRLTELRNAIKAKAYECDHENARRKKDGGRDRRYPCDDCLSVREESLYAIDAIEFDYRSRWSFFAEMGSQIDKKD
jgi:hypothetical protein